MGTLRALTRGRGSGWAWSRRVASAITTSAREVLPARSPIPAAAWAITANRKPEGAGARAGAGRWEPAAEAAKLTDARADAATTSRAFRKD